MEKLRKNRFIEAVSSIFARRRKSGFSKMKAGVRTDYAEIKVTLNLSIRLEPSDDGNLHAHIADHSIKISKQVCDIQISEIEPHICEQKNRNSVKNQATLTINSPMVGTFYRSTAPGERDLVKVGDKIDDNTCVCIIEAMKVMNEIKADMCGTITRVMAEDGKPVQYGQPLFEINQ